MNESKSSLERNLGRVLLFLLLAGCLLVLRPFVSALLWAVVLCVSSWPLYSRLLRLVGNRHTLAAFLMTLGMLLILLLPFVIVGATLADNVSTLTSATRKWVEEGPPEPPQWLGKVPLVGAKAVETWQSLASDSGKLLEKARELIQPAGAALLKGGVVLGQGLLELTLSILIAFFLFRRGAVTAERVNTAVERISGERGR